jgi:hypothetical protein
VREGEGEGGRRGKREEESGEMEGGWSGEEGKGNRALPSTLTVPFADLLSPSTNSP